MITPEYKIWLNDIKSKIRSTQAKAALSVNSLKNFHTPNNLLPLLPNNLNYGKIRNY